MCVCVCVCVEQVLAADLGAVHDCMFANEALLDKLFALLEREAPLNTLLAGYFGKIICTLLCYCFTTTFYYTFPHTVAIYVSSGKIVSTLLSRRPDETLKAHTHTHTHTHTPLLVF